MLCVFLFFYHLFLMYEFCRQQDKDSGVTDKFKFIGFLTGLTRDSSVSLLQRESHHTFTADVTSQTFFDASFRFASHKDSIAISVSSPTTGFLGLYLQRRSLSEVSGKLFCHYLVRHFFASQPLQKN